MINMGFFSKSQMETEVTKYFLEVMNPFYFKCFWAGFAK